MPERRPQFASTMSLKIDWKRPLTYLMVPVLLVLVVVGILPPFPPRQPTKAGQEQSAPEKEKKK